MRPLPALLASIAACALGGLLGLAAAASGHGQTSTCPTPTTTSPYNIVPTIPQPTGNPLDNVTVENCKDNTLQANSALQVAAPHGPNPSPVNFAYAYAHDCSAGCQAIAVAFQVALTPQGSTAQAPQNVALAINFNCNHCGVFAYAYQYAVDVPKGARLSRSTWRQIATIRQAADADTEANLTFAALDTKLKALAAQLRATVDQGLQSQHLSASHKRSSQHLKELGHG